MEDGEKRIKQEDCNEDNLGPGILTLTNKRLAFDKTKSRIMDFTKHMGETILDVPLENVVKTWKEGLFIKKVCFTAKMDVRVVRPSDEVAFARTRSFIRRV